MCTFDWNFNHIIYDHTDLKTSSVTHFNEIPTIGYSLVQMLEYQPCILHGHMDHYYNYFVLCLGLNQMDPNGTWNLCLVSFVWRKHEGTMGWNHKTGKLSWRRCCILLLGCHGYWWIKLCSHHSNSILSRVHSSQGNILKALSTTSSAKHLT